MQKSSSNSCLPQAFEHYRISPVPLKRSSYYFPFECSFHPFLERRSNCSKKNISNSESFLRGNLQKIRIKIKCAYNYLTAYLDYIIFHRRHAFALSAATCIFKLIQIQVQLSRLFQEPNDLHG